MWLSVSIEVVPGALERLAVHRHRVALLELDLDVLGLVRRLADRHRDGVDLLERLVGRVLDLGALVADVPEIAILRVDLLLGLRDRDAVLLGVLDRGLAVGEAVGEEARVLPRRDDRQRRVQRHRRQLEPHLVVALARGAMRDRVGAGLVRDVHLRLGNQRPRDGGAQQVVALVGGMRAQHREAVPLGELLAQVRDDHFVGAALAGLALDALELAALAEFGGKRHQRDAGIALLQPGQDDGGIEAA